jgi:hypothetical protein
MEGREGFCPPKKMSREPMKIINHKHNIVGADFGLFIFKIYISSTQTKDWLVKPML